VPPYRGIETLRNWIRAAEGYVGDEKKYVDDLLGVPANDGVVDLEMALPAWKLKKTAPRMDLVSIEAIDGQLTVFFAEVKLASDKRLRCRGPLVPDRMPEVLEQLSLYRTYLADAENRAQVSEQYCNAASVLMCLRKMANAVGPVQSLGKAISDAAGQQLAVAKLARLIVFDSGRANQGSIFRRPSATSSRADREGRQAAEGWRRSPAFPDLDR
jgi:hypothetical protein